MIESTNKSKNFHLEQLQMKSITHQIVNLKPREKNIELRAIVLELLDTYETKIKERLVQYLISDGSASIVANFFGETGYFLNCIGVLTHVGPQIKEGDILYISGAYTTLYNKKMILYQGIYLNGILVV